MRITIKTKRLLSLLVMFSMVMIAAAASATLKAEAKSSPSLSSGSVTLAMGGSKKISLKSGSGSWSVKGGGVVKVTKKTGKYIKIKPLKAGTATVICKTKGKKLKCKVKVLNNRIGDPKEDLGYATVVGTYISFPYTLEKGYSIKSLTYDKKRGTVTDKSEKDPDIGETEGTLWIKALKPGRFKLRVNTEEESILLTFTFINGFRGKSKVSRTEANYRKWRKKTLASMVSADMSTWEIIDGIGILISTGKYSLKGGATGLQLWYGGNGTCVFGAKMMNDFLHDMGINSKVRFAGASHAVDIFGYNVGTYADHKNTRMTLGGKKWELNNQPGMPWPMGTVAR